MNQFANKAFRHLAGTRSLRSTPLIKLQTLAGGYPYFPIAQLFLVKKLKDDDESYIANAQKAVLYFSNPFVFDYLLNQELAIENEEEDTNLSNYRTDEDIPAEDKDGDQSNTSDQVTETIEVMAGNAGPVSPQTDAFTNEALDENIILNNDTNVTVEDKPDEHEKMYRSIKAMLDSTTEDADQHANDTEISIDPYYTIDYFASQGIRLDLDINPQDKLGQNLKKFTHWLRQMKKLGPEDAKAEIESEVAEADIQKMANSSNNTREVVTEAMALVLEKQGKTAKAIELYSKLSFLNPGKSAFFAAKIEQLKGI